MKSLIKKYLMAIVAVMMVVGFSAFKLAETKTTAKKATKEKIESISTMRLDQWSFTDNNPSNVTNPNHYLKIVGSPPPCSTPEQTVCVIEAPDDGTGKPDLSQHIDPEDPESPTYADLIEEAMQEMERNAVVKDFRPL